MKRELKATRVYADPPGNPVEEPFPMKRELKGGIAQALNFFHSSLKSPSL